MFATKESLKRRTGPFGIGRLSYLQSLVNEFQDTESQDSKLQVLANLANFAYDPINYDYFRQLNIIELFLDCLEECDDRIVEFAIGGLCNLVNDKLNQQMILSNEGIYHLSACLSRSNEDIVFSAISTLIYLNSKATNLQLTSIPIINVMLTFSKSRNSRLRNLANIYLKEVCSPAKVKEALAGQKLWDDHLKHLYSPP